MGKFFCKEKLKIYNLTYNWMKEVLLSVTSNFMLD